MHPAVVDPFDPGGEQPVQLGQVAGAATRVELDEELAAHRAKHPLDLAPAGRLAGFGVGQADAQDRAGPLELLAGECRAVVDVEHLGDPTGGQRGAQRCLQPDGVFGQAEEVADQRSAVVVDEGEQVGLAAGDRRAVQRVAGPQVVGAAASNRPKARGGWSLPARSRPRRRK
jgi:hypothetical protein